MLDGDDLETARFKPYYNWNTFNTVSNDLEAKISELF